MTQKSTITPATWLDFLSDFTDRNRGRRARFEIFSPGSSAEEQQEGHFESATISDNVVTIQRSYESQGEQKIMSDDITDVHGITVQLDTDGSEDTFRARAAALGLAPRVDIQGWMPHAEALARAACCDIGVVLFQPGEHNHTLALPHKLFDAMLAGLPVIAPRFATEVASIVSDTACGELVDPTDPADIAAAIARLADPARRAAMGAAGRNAALTRYSWNAEAERLVALYRRLAPIQRT